MKTLQNNFTTPEQSKRLLELGIPADSADCYYCWYGFNGEHQLYQTTPEVVSHDACVDTIKDRLCHGDIPCWSVGRLIEIYHICDKPGCSFTFNVCFPNLVSEMIHEISLAKERGWIDFSKLEDFMKRSNCNNSVL